jgi:hypothetical protein
MLWGLISQKIKTTNMVVFLVILFKSVILNLIGDLKIKS